MNTNSKKIRKTIVFVMNLLKYLSMILGVIGTLVGLCSIDSPAPYDEVAYMICAISLSMLVFALINEVFTVKFLVRDGEHISTIFNFDWYGLRSRSNYKSYLIMLNDFRRTRKIDFKIGE